MTIDGNNTHSPIFYGHSFRSQPEVPSSTEHPLTTPNNQDTANVADVPGPQEDSPGDVRPLPPLPLPAEPNAGGGLVYLCDLQPRPVEWLWQDRLACGTLAMISGVPGSGKTWIALTIAAALSRGRAPITGEKLEPCTVLYASMEHNSSEVILPRFVGAPWRPQAFRSLARGPHRAICLLERPRYVSPRRRAPANPCPPRDSRFTRHLLWHGHRSPSAR